MAAKKRSEFDPERVIEKPSVTLDPVNTLLTPGHPSRRPSTIAFIACQASLFLIKVQNGE
jgi:hypothetical protein